MKNNQRGGILSKIILIPVTVALMAGFFLLGYYVGKYRNKSGVQGEAMPPLPEIISKNLPKPDEFTFYKTLTAKEDKTVSIDLKPKSPSEEKQTEKKTSEGERVQDKSAWTPKKDKQPENKVIVAPKQQASVKKEAASSPGTNTRLRYTLQIASYQAKEIAEEDVKKMKQKGYAAFIVSSELPGKGTWYRVRLGSFSSKAAAEKLQKELRTKAGISPYITIE
jgi:cell division septation protein DedD